AFAKASAASLTSARRSFSGDGRHAETRMSLALIRAAAPLRSLQSLGLQQWPGSRRDKRQQILRSGRVLRGREHPGRKDRDLLQWIGQRSYDLDAGDRQQLADLLDADLGLAAGNDLADGSAA